jgi:hypothetical protein
MMFKIIRAKETSQIAVVTVVIVDKVHWIFVVRADKIKPLFDPKV